jgi:hypothetical protein
MPGFRNQATGSVAGNDQVVSLEWREAFNGGVGLQVTGTFSGTLTLQLSLDGTNYVALQGTNVTTGAPITTLTAAGVMAANVVGARLVRVIGSGWGSGTAAVTLVGLPG